MLQTIYKQFKLWFILWTFLIIKYRVNLHLFNKNADYRRVETKYVWPLITCLNIILVEIVCWIMVTITIPMSTVATCHWCQDNYIPLMNSVNLSEENLQDYVRYIFNHIYLHKLHENRNARTRIDKNKHPSTY